MPRLEDVIITHRNDRNRQYPHSDYRSYLAIFHAKSGLGPLPPLGSDMSPAVLARVDLGRWLVDCSACAAAVVVDDEDLVFICPKCGGDGNWRAVIMPAEREEIEEILLMRPGFREANRNRFWSPGETLLGLAAENVKNGAPAPEHLEEQLRMLAEEKLQQEAALRLALVTAASSGGDR